MSTTPRRWNGPDETACSCRNRHRPQLGFTLLEMIIVIAVALTMAGVTATYFMPLMNQQHVATAYNLTLTTLRRARDQAEGDMRIYVVTFTAPRTITVQAAGAGNTTCTFSPTGTVLLTTVLPSDMSFATLGSFPNSNTSTAPPTTPDAFGIAAYPVDLDQANNNPNVASVCFNPDGTATDNIGSMAGGVIYLTRGDLYSSRAVTLWGSTGRIRGWRLYNVAGVNTWKQQ